MCSRRCAGPARLGGRGARSRAAARARALVPLTAFERGARHLGDSALSRVRDGGACSSSTSHSPDLAVAGAGSELRALSPRLRLAGLQLHSRAVALHARDRARCRDSGSSWFRLADRSTGRSRASIWAAAARPRWSANSSPRHCSSPRRFSRCQRPIAGLPCSRRRLPSPSFPWILPTTPRGICATPSSWCIRWHTGRRRSTATAASRRGCTDALQDADRFPRRADSRRP